MSSEFRSQIKPYPRTAVYPTSWAGEQTFEQIYDNLAHYVSNVMKNYGFRSHEIPDCLQIGFMVLWEMLSTQRDFLAQKTRRQAVFFVLVRCKISSMRYGEGRYDSLDALTTDDWHSTADEHAISGLETDRDERWAAWATDIDTRIDIEQIMDKLANKYADSLRHLVALYHVTTQVSRVDAARIVHSDPWRWHQRYVIPVRQDVQYEFAQVFLEQHSYPPPESFPPSVEYPKTRRSTSLHREWREQYQRGNTAPAEALLEQYRHTVCIVGAIRAQIDGKSYRQAALDIGRNPKTFPKYMKRAARLLSAAYA